MKTLLVIAAARGLAFFLGGFSLLNLLGEWRSPGFDANLWWIDLRALPAVLGQGVLFAASLCLLSYAVRPMLSRRRRNITAIAVAALLFATLWNLARYYWLLAQAAFHTSFPIPFSLFVAVSLVVLMTALFLTVPSEETSRQRRLAGLCGLMTIAVCLVGFPLAQMICFGLTDYRRPADAIVVFGARVFRDGEPSPALAERIRTSCRLYQAVLAPQIIFSGGPGKGEIDETEAMRRMAIQLGVPEDAVLRDPAGFDTQATVQNTSPVFVELGIRRMLVVSHFYHLPRIKMTYHRAGWEVYTVPAEPEYFLAKLPYFMVREVAALWVYYLRPLTDF